VTASSEDAALAAIVEHKRPPDLIISDYRLGNGKTGFGVIERLRSALGAQIPAFLISGDTAPERLREASASGYYLLHKPVLPVTLRSTVNQLLKEHADRSAGTTASCNPTMVQKSAAIPSPALPPQ
jgi:CheY-like chemotaxis protein